MDFSSQPKIIVGLLQVEADPWKYIYENGQKVTWIKNRPTNIEIINIFGNKPNRIIRFLDLSHEKFRWSPIFQGPIHYFDKQLGRILRRLKPAQTHVHKQGEVFNLIVNFPATHLTLPNVLNAFFIYFLRNTDADYLYLSNTSSYINLKNLNLAVKNFPRNLIYGGTLKTFSNVKYFSGANRILSRDLIEFLVKNFRTWDYEFVEDVSVGKLISNLNFISVEIPSKQFTSEQQIFSESRLTLEKVVHFRLKSGPLKSRKDAVLMNYLHKILD